MHSPANTKNFIETILVTLLLLILLITLYDVVKVFFGVFTFAVIFAVSFHHPFKRFTSLLGNRQRLAAIIYSVLLIAIIASPFIYLISALAHHIRGTIHWVNEARVNGVPPLPEWITHLPYIGSVIADFWKDVQSDPKEAMELHESQLKPVLYRILHSGAGVMGAVTELILGIVISAIFLVNEQRILRPIDSMIRHLFGETDGPALLSTSAQAVRGVSIGVIGTAFIAAVFSWIGLTIAGIHFALALAAVVFFLVLIQVGPVILWIPLVIWMYVEGRAGWAIFVLAWGVLLLIIDAVLKPILIAKSGKLPFLVLFLGVIGGMVAWGFTGMFKGAIILAVFYTLFNSWLERTRRPVPELANDSASQS